MVKAAVTAGDDPERALALSYAPAERREALAALFALDARLRRITLAARDPTIGLMRLTWWADALEKLDGAPPPAEPVLTGIAELVLPHGVTGAALAGMVDGWERLLNPDELDLPAFAAERGGRLFAAAGTVLGREDERLAALGEGWALAELARDRPAVAGDARRLTGERLADGFRRPWPRALRALSAMALLARFDVEGTTRAGSPRRVARLLAHRLTGR